MRSFWLSTALLLFCGLLAGCGDEGGGESTATPANPQAGLDAVKKLQGLPKTSEKGATTAPAADAAKKN